MAAGKGDVYGSTDNGRYARSEFGLQTHILSYCVRDDDIVTNDQHSGLFRASMPTPPVALPPARHALYSTLSALLACDGRMPLTVAGVASQIVAVDAPATPGICNGLPCFPTRGSADAGTSTVAPARDFHAECLDHTLDLHALEALSTLLTLHGAVNRYQTLVWLSENPSIEWEVMDEEGMKCLGADPHTAALHVMLLVVARATASRSPPAVASRCANRPRCAAHAVDCGVCPRRAHHLPPRTHNDL